MQCSLGENIRAARMRAAAVLLLRENVSAIRKMAKKASVERDFLIKTIKNHLTAYLRGDRKSGADYIVILSFAGSAKKRYTVQNSLGSSPKADAATGPLPIKPIALRKRPLFLIY